jgi:hypothetical protein
VSSRRLLLLTVLLAATPGSVGLDPRSAIGAETAVLDIVRAPEQFVGRVLTVRGAMSPWRPLPAAGRGVFELRDGAAVVTILSPIMPACPPSSMVTVDGRFHRLMQIELQPVSNVIEAFSVVCR